MKQLIVNADDFGLTAGINAAVVQAHLHGIVSSTTLMVHGAAAEEAAAWARQNPSLGVGLHIDLWEHVLRDGEWVRTYEHCAGDANAVLAEIESQLARFRSLLGREPDHIDTHQHVHRRQPVGDVVRAFATRHGLALREHGGLRYVGGFYGQDGTGRPYPEGITPERLMELIDLLPDGAVTELSCHPGQVAADDALGGTMYRVERNTEVQSLCDPRVRARVARGDVRLGTFADFAVSVGASS
jgi:chitin disaccharide deacetylase